MAEGLQSLVKRGNKLRLKIKKLEDQQTELKEELNGIKHEILKLMNKEGHKSFGGVGGKAHIRERTIFNIADYNKFSAYVIKNKALDLLPRSVKASGVTDRLKAGQKLPPGLVEGTTITVVITD